MYNPERISRVSAVSWWELGNEVYAMTEYKDGQQVDSDGQQVDKDGRQVDKDGRQVNNDDGRQVDKAGRPALTVVLLPPLQHRARPRLLITVLQT